MTTTETDGYLAAAIAAYERATPRSRALHERAIKALPGGTTRTTVTFGPYPVAMDSGAGATVVDVDGNERLDFIQNYTALILGHAHPAITAAVTNRAARGTAFAATNVEEVGLAEELCRRVPSVERVRFCSSGTEATMFAMRVARAYSGRPAIARMEGGYHGTHDLAEVSAHPDLALAGSAAAPIAVPDSAGTPSWAVDNTVVLPYNDADAAEAILRREHGRLAAVIVEPILGAGGMIPPAPGFLERLRQVTSELGLLLIFDEIITLRVAPGGAQERYGVRPDLTTMGKIIGGGLPVAAFGGREDLMAQLDPNRPGSLAQGGTYNGNPLGMAAGLAAMQALPDADYVRLEALGDRLRGELQAVFDRHDVAAQVTGVASLFQVHFTGRPVVDYRSARSDERHLRAFFLGMLGEGILLAPRGAGSICTPMGDAEIARFLAAAERVAAGMAGGV
ncbi:MAG: aspartate aminotransferase family protein [Candidatus Dormiibacterota bacterium]